MDQVKDKKHTLKLLLTKPSPHTWQTSPTVSGPLPRAPRRDPCHTHPNQSQPQLELPSQSTTRTRPVTVITSTFSPRTQPGTANVWEPHAGITKVHHATPINNQPTVAKNAKVDQEPHADELVGQSQGYRLRINAHARK